MKTLIALASTLLLGTAGVLGVGAAGGHDARAMLHAHLKSLGAGVHAAAHPTNDGQGHGGSMAGLFAEGELNAEQLERLVALDRAFAGFHRTAGSLHELHERLLAGYEQGGSDAATRHGLIDRHFDRMRDAAYEVSDRMTQAMDSLDASQRQRLLHRLRGAAHHGLREAT